MRTRLEFAPLALLLGFGVYACADPEKPEESGSASPETTPAMTREERIELRRKMQQQRVVEPVPQVEAPAVTGEVPDELLNNVLADLEQRTGAPRTEFEVLRGEAVLWNDGSLGCPKPGIAYQQVQTPGYWIVVEHGGTEHDYRASQKGFFTLCENPGVRGSPVSGKEKGPRDGAPVQ